MKVKVKSYLDELRNGPLRGAKVFIELVRNAINETATLNKKQKEVVKQVVSQSLTITSGSRGMSYPVLVVTLATYINSCR
jgi:hypothetical protein